MTTLRREVGPGTVILVGGSAAARQPEAMAAAGTTFLPSLDELPGALREALP
jgi:hypothetical protein